MAIKIDDAERSVRKETSHNDWFRKNAEMMDLELDEDLLKETEDEVEKRQTKKNVAVFKVMLADNSWAVQSSWFVAYCCGVWQPNFAPVPCRACRRS